MVRNLFGRIYLKLYLSFVVIFLLTLLVTALVSSSFYGARVRRDFDDFFRSQARFLRKEFLRNCGTDLHSPGCGDFFSNLNEVSQLRFWVIAPDGSILLSHHDGIPPPINAAEIQRAATGEFVTTFPPHENPHMIVPVQDPSGRITQLIVLQRTLFARSPHIPLMISLALAALILGLLVLPLSLRVTRPIRELHRTGQEWAEGHLQERADTSGADEIAELAAVFNTMAGNLERMLQQRKEFFAFVSHELKSPLARIKVALEMISDKSSVEVLPLIAGIERDLSESEKLIEQLLILSRIEMQFPVLVPVEIDLVDPLNRALLAVQPLAVTAGIRISMETGTGAKVRGDADQIQRAFTNILENAIKFSPSGSEVRIHLRPMEQKVEIRFTDQGVGIDPAEAGKIFEPFYRGKRTEKKEGFGLGLFLAKRVIDLHGGSINAVSGESGGTEITIELPRIPAEKTA